ncbi:unnamed protein product [Vicia faba]|uniref:Uncharacterized protein n=1 Tax=Vicia faba TaxID=3906 RepID=A0AAV0YYB0_VICFA|nr:unnamed protein product [Vicia faba]
MTKCFTNTSFSSLSRKHVATALCISFAVVCFSPALPSSSFSSPPPQRRDFATAIIFFESAFIFSHRHGFTLRLVSDPLSASTILVFNIHSIITSFSLHNGSVSDSTAPPWKQNAAAQLSNSNHQFANHHLLRFILFSTMLQWHFNNAGNEKTQRSCCVVVVAVLTKIEEESMKLLLRNSERTHSALKLTFYTSPSTQS